MRTEARCCRLIAARSGWRSLARRSARREPMRRRWPSRDPDAPTVGVSLDKTEAHVGDRLTLTVSAVAKAGIAVTLPPKLDLGKLELLDRNDGDKIGRDLGDGRRSHRFVLGVAAYETGELEVPSLEVTYLTPRGRGAHRRDRRRSRVNVRPLVAADEAHPERAAGAAAALGVRRGSARDARAQVGRHRRSAARSCCSVAGAASSAARWKRRAPASALAAADVPDARRPTRWRWRS